MSVLNRSLLFKNYSEGTPLAVLWLRLHAPNAGGPGLIPHRETRSHMLQIRAHVWQLKPSAARLKN